jgi:hypothetical protein
MTRKIKVVTEYDPSDFEGSINACMKAYVRVIIRETHVTEIAGSRPRYTAIIEHG